RAGHEAEGLAVLQAHVRGVTENAELLRRLFERGELLEKLFLGELLLRETAFRLIVGVDEVFHGDAPLALGDRQWLPSVPLLRFSDSVRIGTGSDSHAARTRSSRLLRMASQRRSPSFLRSVSCACSQRGTASRNRARPFFVICNVRLRRQ